MDVRRILGENVRRIRLTHRLSQEAVAERMGVDRAYVSGIERGVHNPTLLTLFHLARALKASVSDLVEKC